MVKRSGLFFGYVSIGEQQMMEFDAVLPYDPIKNYAYINAIGSNSTEAAVNVDLCEDNDEVLKRLEYVPVKVLMPTRT